MTNFANLEWRRKGATVSAKKACREYGLCLDELLEAVRLDQLQYRVRAPDTNPSLQLLRREVELLVERNYGGRYLKDQLSKTELATIDRKLEEIQELIETLAKRRSQLLAKKG